MRNTILSNALVAIMMFLLGAGAAQAQTVIFDTVSVPPDPAKAIGIDGLVVDGTTYDVDFTARTNPGGAYGNFPGVLDFTDEASAAAALAAVDSALNGAPAATTVGAPYNTAQDSYVIGYLAEEDAANGLLYHVTSVFDVSWQRIDFGGEFMPWNAVSAAKKSFALFTPIGAAAPTIDFSADPETIESGQSSALSWSVLDATTCTGSDGWSGDKDPISGTEDVSPTVSSTYVLTCDGPGGPSDSQVSVAVLDSTLATTEVRQSQKVNSIFELAFGPSGTYTKPAFPLLLAQSSITDNTLFHDGGSFTFSSPQTQTTYPYGNWAFEIRSTCGPDGDACLVQTDNGTPWALSNVDISTGSARMVFTQEGADAFNDLAVVPSTVEVFVTSQSFPGDLRGSAGALTSLDGADNLCTQAAKDAGLEGTWTAWLSQGNVGGQGNLDVVDRMFDAEFRLLDGTLVADSLADLTDGTLGAAINLDENGDTVNDGFNSRVWTATETDGTYGDSGTCLQWTSSDPVQAGQVGEASDTDAGWTDVGGGNSCDNLNRLYCFSASKFLAEETFADVTFIPEPSAAALGAAALTMLGLIRIRRASRRGRR